MRTHYLLALHQKAAACLELVEKAKAKQKKMSEQAALTLLDWRERPVWATFPELVEKSHREAAFAPKVVIRLEMSYLRIVNKINSVVHEERIA